MAYRNIEDRRAACRAWSKANPDKIRAASAKWRAANREKVRAANAARYAANKDRHNAYNSATRKANPQKTAAAMRRRLYGTDGVELLVAQGGLCAGCGLNLSTVPPKHRHLDHDHLTKVIRGWLCHRCNLAIGLTKDSPERLRALANYLERASQIVRVLR